MGVKIEVFRMMVYLSFPVAMFWISNQAEYFEEYIVKQALEDFKERMRNRREQKMLRQMGMQSEE
uniref:Uncharacterized protein n=1 Tax=Cyprinus carpio TaxID=7962 RepID=A0A8C0YF84_CYPCA